MIYLANGYSNQCLADVHVEYIGSEVADPYDINAPWETLLQVTDPNVVRANLKNERFFDCPRTQARYLRLKISNPNTIVFKSDSDLTEEEKQIRRSTILSQSLELITRNHKRNHI